MSSINPATKAENQALTEKEQVFLEWYFITWNGAKSAIKAGYCLDHPTNARLCAYEILNKPYIKRAIAERIAAVCMDANEVLARLAAIARADITDYMVQDPETNEWHVDIGKLKTSGLGFLIKSFEPNRLGQPKVEMYSAMDALDKLAKHLNLLKQPDTEVNISMTAWAQFIQQARENYGKRPASAVVDGKFIETDLTDIPDGTTGPHPAVPGIAPGSTND